MTGSISDVSSPSGVRIVRRRLRPTMVNESDMGGLLLLLLAGQGEEHVVEGGGVDREPPHRAAARVDLVEQRPHVRGAPVGRDPDGEAARVAPDRALAE